MSTLSWIEGNFHIDSFQEQKMLGKLVNLSREKKLKRHLQKSYTEMFLLMMPIRRLGLQMEKATIMHSVKK